MTGLPFVERPLRGSRGSRLYIPPLEECADLVLMRPKHLHINILVWTCLASEKEINSPPSRNPPGHRQWSEEGSNILGIPGLPEAIWMRAICHVTSPIPVSHGFQ